MDVLCLLADLLQFRNQDSQGDLGSLILGCLLTAGVTRAILHLVDDDGGTVRSLGIL